MPCKKISVECPLCHKIRSIDSTDVKRAKLNGLCLTCYRTVYQKGENNPDWKGGKYKQHGYIHIRMPNHPHANHSGYIRRCRLVMEQVLGRYLLPEERVHHINGIKDEDKPENLVILTNSEHMKFHRINTSRDWHGRFKKS